MKIHLIAIIRAKDEFREEVLAVLEDMVVKTRKEEACNLYNLHQGVDDKNLFTFYEIWENKAGLDKHNAQPYIMAFGDLIPEKLTEKPKFL